MLISSVDRCVHPEQKYQYLQYVKMQYLLIILAVSFLFIRQTLTDQNCEISLDRNTNGSIYQYNMEPINITIRANVTDTESCTWSEILNGRTKQVTGNSGRCTYNLLLISNITRVSCTFGVPPKRYRISFEYSE